MQKLTGTDAAFLYNESENTPQHVGSLQYLEVPPRSRKRYFETLRRVMLERAHLLPYLTNRLQHMPWDVDHPVWVRHTAFDIDQHLHRVQLPSPGTQAQLESLVAELYEPVLERDRPLWQMWLIEGLANGQVALLTKTHHACLDGMSGVAAQEVLGDPTRAIRKVEAPPADFWRAEDTSPAALLRESWFNLARYRVDQWARRPAEIAAAARAARRAASGQSQQPANGPKAPWNAPIDGRRAIAGAAFSLSALKQVAKATGTKINDVVLGITAEALNRYVQREGIELTGAMIAGCPVSLRQPGDTTLTNKVTMMGVSLANDVADPVERLAAIHAASDAAKAALADVRDAMPSDFGAPFLPAQHQAFTRMTADGEYAANGTTVPMNVVVSNVPGLKQEIWMAGARMVGNSPISIVAHGGGLNVTVVSYADRMELGLTGAARVIPNLAELRDDFVAAYADLLERLDIGTGEDEEEEAATEVAIAAG